jgi:hypothetical protein
MKNGTAQPVLSRPAARRHAAKVLGIALQTRLRRLYDAQSNNDENEIIVATADMAQCMYENVEFVIWALKSVGGMNPPPPEALKPISKHHVPSPPANDDPRFKKPPEPVLLPDECTCPPLEHGIIGRDKHMTSCPQYAP